MLPVARTALRRIGDGTDVVTYVSRYTRGRFASAFGPHAALEYVPPGVDTDRFAPDPAARAEMRSRYGLGDRPVVVCLSRLVPRKGQDMLIRALPADPRPRRRRRAGDRRRRPLPGHTAPARPRRPACQNTSSSPAACPAPSCPPTMRWPTCSRCRAGPAERAWTSRVSASSSSRRRRPACRSWRGDSGGAPETVRHGETGLIVDGTDRRRRSQRRQAKYSPTRTGPPGWARRDGAGSSTTGSGAARRRGLPDCSRLSPCRRALRCRRRTSRRPPCA